MKEVSAFFKKLFNVLAGDAAIKPVNEKIDFQYAVNKVKNYAIIIYDANGRITSWNDGAEYMSGLKAEYAVGKSFEIFYSKEDVIKGEPWQNLELATELGHLEKNAKRVKRDGKIGWANIVYTALKDEAGNITGFLVIVRDITEEKETKDQLELFSRQINQSNDSIYTVDASYKITSWNEGAEKLYGYTKEEALGKIPNELLKTNITHSDLSAALNIIEEDGYWNGELIRTTKAGEEIYVRSSTSNMRDVSGRVTGFIGVSFNISSQKKLQTQVNYLASIVEQSTDAIRSSDLNQRIITWNKGAEKLYGYTKEEAIGKTSYSLGIIKRTTVQTKAFFDNVLEKGFVKTEIEFFHKNGSSFFGSVTASAVKNDRGEVDSLVFIVKDISERKQLEEQLKQSNEDLEQKVKERTEEIYRTEKRFRALVENSEGVTTLLDKNFEAVYTSPALERITGWSEEERKQHEPFEMAHPDEIPYHINLVKNLLENPGKPIAMATRTKHKDGHYVWLEGVITNMVHDPIVGGIISNFIDITGRRRIEEAKERAEILYSKLFENMLQGFAYCKAEFENGRLKDCIYLAVNNEYEQQKNVVNITGKRMSEVMPELLNPDAVYIELISMVALSGNSTKFESYIKPTGKWFSISLYSPEKEYFVCLLDDISERKRSEEAIRKSEILYRSLFENMQHGFAYSKGIFEEDRLKDSIYLAVNNKWEEQIGVKNITGKKMSEVLPGILESDPAYAGIITKVALTGNSTSLETYTASLDKWFSVSHYSPEKEYFVSLVDDITERKRAEEAKRKTEMFYSKLFENMRHGFAYFEAIFEDGQLIDCIYLAVNEVCEQNLGAKNIVGKKMSEVTPGLLESDPFYAARISAVVLSGNSAFFETYVAPLDIWFSISLYSPERGYFVSLVDNITERKRAEEVIRKSEVLYRNLFENMLHGFAYCKGIFKDNKLIDFSFIAVNNKYEAITGLNNITGKKISELLPGIIESDTMYSDEITKAVLTGKPTRFESYIAQLDKWLSISVYSPEKEYFVSLVDNITERKTGEEKIKKLNEELEERVIKRTEQLKKTNEELEAFSYSVSHDLRAPLRGIIGFTSILEEEYIHKLDAEATRITSVIKMNTIRMGHLIDDLLSFSRMSRQDIIKTTFDTGKVVDEIIRETNSLNENNQKINWIIHTLPIVTADINTIRQVWVNLISNAVKYSGKVNQSRIEIGSFRQRNEIVFFIKDNGTGFDEKYKERLFRVFQRLHSQDEYEGTGIGLAIVEKIISKHDGKVWAHAELDKGASFYFSLPADGNININSNNEKSKQHESKLS